MFKLWPTFMAFVQSLKRAFPAFPLFLALHEMVVYLSNDMFMPSLLAVQAYFGCSVPEAQSMMVYWMIGACSVMLFLGPIAERYGRKPVVLGGVICFLAGTLLCLTSPTLGLFLIGRVLQGCACCSLRAAGYATLQNLYEGPQAAKMLSNIAAVATLSPAVGPTVGSLVLKFGAWQWIFIIVLVLGFFSLLGLAFYMPAKTPRDGTQRLSLLESLVEYKRILKAPVFLLGNSCHGLLAGGAACWTASAPVIVMQEFNISAAYMGLVQLPVFGASITGALITRHLASHRPLTTLIRWGALCGLVAVSTLAFKSFFAPLRFLELLAGMCLFCIGCGMANSPLATLTPKAIPYSMSCKSALFFFNSTVVATLFACGIIRLYKGNCAVLMYMLCACSVGVFALQHFLAKHFKGAPI